ncbi:primosomal protein N' family DNA-binding protein [Legionella tunisiensis]|nr:hypothetical protein [Legionella tunisiensis]
MAATIYKVCVPHTNRDYFDYQATTLSPCIGARVWVPFRQKTRLGVVVGQGPSAKTYDSIKSILSVIDEQPLLNETMLTLCQWVANYYQAPLSEVIPLALPKNTGWGKTANYPLLIIINWPCQPKRLIH